MIVAWFAQGDVLAGNVLREGFQGVGHVVYFAGAVGAAVADLEESEGFLSDFFPKVALEVVSVGLES